MRQWTTGTNRAPTGPWSRWCAAAARTRSSRECGARDYRNIGHKAIFVANAWRTLQTIGWQHAEPTLRSLALGLLDFGKDERVNNYAFQDQAFLSNVRLAQRAAGSLPGDWSGAASDTALTGELLAAIRKGQIEPACQAAAQALVQGKAQAAAVWDAVHLAAGELMMRQPGIYGIHTVTSVNALHYAFRMSGNPETRLILLLQGVGWMCQFASFMAGARGGLGATEITKIEPADLPGSAEAAADEILATIATDAGAAAAKAFHFAQAHPEPDVFADAARRLVYTKAQEVHYYKYSAAIFEDYDLVTPRWRPHMLATAVYYLCGSGMPDSPVMQRAREAVRSLG
jgi:hypothetical protein